jgi:hypothetical protein
LAQVVHEVGGEFAGGTAVCHLGITKIFPAHTAHSCASLNAFLGENVANEAAVLARLVEQGEGLEPFITQLTRRVQGADAQIALAFVAHHQQWMAIQADDEQGFFKAGVKVGEVGEVSKMFAVAVNHEVGESCVSHSGAGSGQTRFKFAQSSGRRAYRRAKFRPINFNQFVFGGHGFPR